MTHGDWKDRLIREWTYLVLSLLLAVLIWHLLPRIFSEQTYFNFYFKTGMNLGDFAFFGLIASIYLVRTIRWFINKQRYDREIH